MMTLIFFFFVNQYCILFFDIIIIWVSTEKNKYFLKINFMR